ncbi:MAG: hypothetical protein ACOYXS_00025 [Chloroflexota bacterium]
MIGPFVVVEGPDEAFEHAVAEQRATGRWIVEGFTEPGDHRPAHRGPVIRAGAVATTDDAAAALLAALDGSGLVIAARAPREVIDRLLDDLRHLGPVDHRIGPVATVAHLDHDARAILGLLAEGHTLGEAARVLGLSRRTADRRLAEARRELGVERTAEAVARAKRLGWLR